MLNDSFELVAGLRLLGSWLGAGQVKLFSVVFLQFFSQGLILSLEVLFVSSFAIKNLDRPSTIPKSILWNGVLWTMTREPDSHAFGWRDI